MKSFRTNDVLIRKFKKSDVEQAVENLYNPNNISNLCDVTINKSKNETQKIIESAMIEYYTEEPIWALEKKKTKDLVGFIKVDNYSPKNKICNISWAVSDEILNETLITEAFRKVMKYLFDKRGIELIECSYYNQNEKTGEILDFVGMKKEAILKQRRINEITHEKEDFIIYSIDVDDFNKLEMHNT